MFSQRERWKIFTLHFVFVKTQIFVLFGNWENFLEYFSVKEKSCLDLDNFLSRDLSLNWIHSPIIIRHMPHAAAQFESTKKHWLIAFTFSFLLLLLWIFSLSLSFATLNELACFECLFLQTKWASLRERERITLLYLHYLHLECEVYIRKEQKVTKEFFMPKKNQRRSYIVDSGSIFYLFFDCAFSQSLLCTPIALILLKLSSHLASELIDDF